jgi:hypothetical protein
MYMFCPILARFFKSADKAFMIEYMAWSIDYKRVNKVKICFHNEQYWMWNTHDAWAKLMPWVSKRSIRRYLEDLKEAGFIKTARLSEDSWDAKLFYTLDHKKLAEIGWSSHYSKAIEVAKLDIEHLSKKDISSSVPIPKKEEIKKNSKEERENILNSSGEKKNSLSQQNISSGESMKTQDLKVRVQIPKSDASQIDKNQSGIDPDSLEQEWYSWAREKTRAVRFSLKEISAGISEMKTAYDLDEKAMKAIFAHIKSSAFFRQRLLNPRDWGRKCGATNMIEAVLMEVEAKRERETPKTEKDLSFEDFASKNF